MIPRWIRLLSTTVALAATVATFGPVGSASAQTGSTSATSAHQPVGALDSVNYDEATNTIAVRGWAADQDGTSATQRVHLYVDGKGFLAIGTGQARPDVARHYPALGATTGFSVRTRAPADRGNHEVCAYAINQGGGTATKIGCRTDFFSGTIVGHIDKATNLHGEQVNVLRLGAESLRSVLRNQATPGVRRSTGSRHHQGQGRPL